MIVSQGCYHTGLKITTTNYHGRKSSSREELMNAMQVNDLESPISNMKAYVT